MTTTGCANRATVVRLLLLAAVILAGGACQDDPKPATGKPAPPASQSFDEAMRVACDAPDSFEQPPESAGPDNRAMMLAVWIDQRVHNHEVRALLGGAGTGDEKIAALESGARRAGIARCALAELWRGGTQSKR